MTKEQLLSNKTKLEKGVNNPNLTDAQKELAKKRLAEIEAKLADLEKEPETKEPAKEPAKKLDKPSVAANQQTMSASDSAQLNVKAKKKPKENKEAFKSDCTETIAQIRLLVDDAKGKKPSRPAKPAPVKRTSEILSDGISSVIVRSIRKELKLDKVGKIKLPKLREARDKFAEALRAMRIALGGISNDNDQFIVDFTTEVNKIFDEVEERQKKVEVKQAA